MAKPYLPLFAMLLGMSASANGFDAQGHRGTRGLVAENTLASFAKALSIGVNTLELDVGISSDNVVVVIHNPRLEPEIVRDSNGNWLQESGAAIHSLTLVELKTFDVGGVNPVTRYHQRFPEQVSVHGAQIPTLEEVIMLLKRSGSDRIGLNIETKLKPIDTHLFASPSEFVTAILDVLRSQDFLHRVTIQSFDWRTLKLVQDMEPNIPTSYLTAQQGWMDNILVGEPGASPWTAKYDIDDYNGSLPRMIKAAGGNIWSAYHQEVSAESIAEAHALGLVVKVWTVDDPERMLELINMGVDGIITDYPDRLIAVLKKLGMPLPTQHVVSP
ncbi:MAG: glycerophosphoryl diester phosphodiesterase [Parasphingorhabdus sp.]|jgi:glycerophosphoryl diester phosphodiesterase